MGGFCVLPIGDSLVQYVQFNSYLEMANAAEHMNMVDMFVMQIPIFIVGFLFILFIGHRFYSTAEYQDTIEAPRMDDGKLTDLSPAKDKFAIILFFASVVAMVVVNATDVCPMYVIPYISVAIALLIGVVEGPACLKAINWNIIFMIAGTLPLSAAISNTGLGETIAYGISINDVSAYYMNYAEAAEALANGDIDAAFQTGGYPIAGIQQYAATTSFRMLPVAEDVIGQVTAEYPFAIPTTIPAGVYENQANDSEVTTLAYQTCFFTSSWVEEEKIYEFTKLMMETLDAYHDTNDATRQISNETVATEYIPFHPGAERYFREAGILAD